MTPGAGKGSSAREALLPVATAVPMGTPVVPVATPIAVAPPRAEEMYREPVSVADDYHWSQTLGEHAALVLRERLYLSQIFCQACEKKTSYSVGALAEAPAGGLHMRDEDIVAHLRPGAFEVREESTCICRYLLHQARELRLGYFAPRLGGGQPGDGLWEGGLAGFGWPEGETPGLVFERPFRCTLCCCCVLLNPQEIGAHDRGTPIGGTRMEWDTCMACWPYRRYALHDGEGAKEYAVRVPLLCADGGRNCCAPSCFNHVFTMPITKADGDEEVGAIESHWPGCAPPPARLAPSCASPPRHRACQPCTIAG